MNKLEPKTCTCGICGEKDIPIPTCPSFFQEGVESYDITNVECPNCNGRSTGGNFKTGEVDSWMSELDLIKCQREMAEQEFLSDVRDMWLAEEEY